MRHLQEYIAESRFNYRVTAEQIPHASLAANFASGGSGSLGQVGASAKEVRHKAERKIPGNAASIYAEGSKASSPLAGPAVPRMILSLLRAGRAESRRL
jgi:hypothetical protein